MAKITRKSAKIFAEGANAAIGGIAQFGSLAAGTPNYSKDPDVIQQLGQYAQGWSAAVLGTKSPAMEDRNAIDYLLSYQIAYLLQRGIPEWLDTETYYQGSFVSKSAGALYVSKVDNNTNHDPATDTSETYWMKFPTPAEVASTYVKKAGDTMTGALTVQANISSTGSISASTVSASTSMTTVTPGSSSDDTTVPTTAWVKSRLGELNMLGRMDYSSAVATTVGSGSSKYTCPSKGYIFIINIPSGIGYFTVNNSRISSSQGPSGFSVEFFPVSEADQVAYTLNTATITFVPEL